MMHKNATFVEIQLPMKRAILITILALFAIPAFSQTDFFAFFDSLDQKQTEQFVFSDNKCEVSDLLFGKFPCSATLEKSPSSEVLERLTVVFRETEAPNTIDELLVSHFGKPYLAKTDPGNYITMRSMTWYKDCYRIDALALLGKSDSYIFSVRWFDNREPDFRQSHWGDSIADVNRVETKANTTGLTDSYYFHDSVAGMPCAVLFSFTDGELSEGTYSFELKHSNKNNFIDDYNKLVTLLTKKYGKPSEDEPHWLNTLYKDDYQDYGYAISRGHLFYKAEWNKPLTIISVYLAGENSEINLYIHYSSTKLESKRKAAREQEEMKGL